MANTENIWLRNARKKAKQSSIPMKIFFTSSEYNTYSQNAAKNAITGVGRYLRREGFSVSDAEIKKRVSNMQVTVAWDEKDGTVAKTNGGQTYINAASPLLERLSDIEKRNSAVQGLRAHENAHSVFTDFPQKKLWRESICHGKLEPEPIEEKGTDSWLELTEALKTGDKMFYQAFCMEAHGIDNSLEDGYIKREWTSMYPGTDKYNLSVVNTEMIEGFPSMEDDFNHVDEAGQHLPPFVAMLNQILLYAKFDYMEFGDYNGEYRALVEKCLDYIDEAKVERDPVKRSLLTNEILCVLGHELIEYVNLVKDALQQNQSPQGSGSGQGGQQGSSQGSQLTQDDIDKALQDLQDAIQKTGAGQTPQGNTNSLANPNGNPNASNLSGANDQNSSQQSEDTQGDVKSKQRGTPPNQGSLGRGGSEEGSNVVSNISTQLKQRQLKEDAEKARLDSLKQEMLETFNGEQRVNASLVRKLTIDASLIKKYNELASELLPISKALQRRVLNVLKARQQNEKETGLLMGRRFEGRSLVRNDGKYFSRNIAPSNEPSIYFTLLVDESGSMGGEGEEAARRTAFVIEDFCRNLDIPHSIHGYESGYDDNFKLKAFAEPDDIDGKDKYRIMGITADGGTPTYPALKYEVSRMNKRTEDVKVIIIISDGGSDNGLQKGPSGKPILQELTLDAKRKNINIIAAGIGASRKCVEAEFPGCFLDISNQNELPTTLCNILKRLTLSSL